MVKDKQPFTAFKSPLTGSAFNRFDLTTHGLRRAEARAAERVVLICDRGSRIALRALPLALRCAECLQCETMKVPKTERCACGRLSDGPVCAICFFDAAREVL